MSEYAQVSCMRVPEGRMNQFHEIIKNTDSRYVWFVSYSTNKYEEVCSCWNAVTTGIKEVPTNKWKRLLRKIKNFFN